MLAELGWDETWAALAALHRPYGTPARVARADTDHALIHTNIHTNRGEVRTVLPAGMTLVTGDRSCSPPRATAATRRLPAPQHLAGAAIAALAEVGPWLRDRYDARLRAEQRRRWKEAARAKRSGPRR